MTSEDLNYNPSGYFVPPLLEVPADTWRCVLEHVVDKADQLSNRLVCTEAALAYPACLIKEYSDRRRMLYFNDFPWAYLTNVPADDEPHHDLKLARYHEIKNYSDEYDTAILTCKWNKCLGLIQQANEAVETFRERIQEAEKAMLTNPESPAATPMP